MPPNGVKLQPIIESENMKLATNIKLSSYVGSNIIPREFDYAGFSGWAEIIGWQIIVFRRHDNTISVISLEEMNTPIIKDICTAILKDLNLPLSVGMKTDALIQTLGMYIYQDDILVNEIRYYFRIQNYLIVCGMHNTVGLKDIEIIYDSEIINSCIENFL